MRGQNQNNQNNRENGNALWFILIAVVLLGLLTMVLSRGGSSVDQSGDYEQQRIKSSQILRYAKSIEAAIQEMKLRGVSENDISFENGTTSNDYTNGNCDSANDSSYPDCMIFDVEGAGLAYRDFSEAQTTATNWIFTGANNVGTTAGPIGTTAEGSGNDLIMLLPNMKSSVCIQINRDLEVGTAGTLPVDTTGIDTTEFTGSFPTGGPTLLDGDPTPFELDNQIAGCFTDNNASVTYFYYVLLAR